MDKYSVLMPVYYKDDPDNLILAINSMLTQSVMPEQFIIVKDGQLTKELDEVIESYVKRYRDLDNLEGLFTIIQIEENRGLPNALNVGLKASRNELVARMDADDISLKERCKKELELFEKYPQLEICGCNIAEFYDNTENIKSYRIVPCEYEGIKKFFRKRTPFNHPTVMYKKSSVEKNGGYDIKIRRKQDFDLFSRMIVNGAYARNVNEVLLLFRANESNFLRRKSYSTLRNAFVVYWRHYKRGGCGLIDFFIISCGEIIFFLIPVGMMKIISNNILRKNRSE